MNIMSGGSSGSIREVVAQLPLHESPGDFYEPSVVGWVLTPQSVEALAIQVFDSAGDRHTAAETIGFRGHFKARGHLMTFVLA